MPTYTLEQTIETPIGLEFTGCDRTPAPTVQAQMPLTMASVGQPLKLVKITASHQLAHRLTEMGLTPGVQFQVMQDQGGPLLLSLRNTRLALGRGMASKVIVEAA